MVSLVIALIIAFLALANYIRHKSLPVPSIAEVTAGQIVPPDYLYSIEGGTGATMLRRPLGAAFGPNGNLYVTDTDNGRIAVFTTDGVRLFDFSNEANKKKLLIPIYLGIDSRGDVFVSDRGAMNMAVFNQNGRFLRYYYPNNNPSFRWLPVALTFDKYDNLYVVDIFYDHRILKIDPKGRILMSIGIMGEAAKGSEEIGKLAFPNGVAVDDDGMIYVADSNNRRIQIFTAQGKLKRVIITGGMPRGIAIDSLGRIVAVDTLGHFVNIYDKLGSNLATFGERGNNYGQFQYPNGLAIGDDNRIFVTDRENNRVQVWGFAPTIPLAARPVAQAVAKWGWFFIPPLLALWFLARRNIFVASPAFINQLVESGNLEQAAKKVKRLYVTPDVYKKFWGVRYGDVDMSTFLREKGYYDDLVEEFVASYSLPKSAAMLLSAMKRGINKKTLLVGDARPKEILEDLGIKHISYSEFVEKFLKPES